MAMNRPKTIGDAPVRGPEHSGGRRRCDFLASRGMGVAQGKKVASGGVAAQTIEAQPVFGQIKPSKRPGASGAEQQSEKRWRISVGLHKRSNRFTVEKETMCGKGRQRQPRNNQERKSLLSL
jgi:hypothetical protein